MHPEASIHKWEHQATPHHQKPVEDDKPRGKNSEKCNQKTPHLSTS